MTTSILQVVTCNMGYFYMYMISSLAESVFKMNNFLFWGLKLNTTFQLSDPPEIVTVPSDKIVTEGNGVTLFRNATGNPPPSIAWTKEASNTVLPSSETLPLTNLRSGDNGAVYICKVENYLASKEANATITVLCEY